MRTFLDNVTLSAHRLFFYSTIILSTQLRMDIVIIDDELKAANDLKFLITSLVEHARVCAILRSVEESVNWLGANPAPDLIFSDVQLRDGLSFEIFKSLDIRTPIVFYTAYNEYAFQAFNSNGIDYLLKPVERENLLNTFLKLKNLREVLNKGYEAYTQKLENVNKRAFKDVRNILLVYFKDRIIPIRIGKIDVVRAINNVVYVYTGSKRYEIRDTLDNLTSQLDPKEFYRANRQFIVHRKSIVSVEHLIARKLAIRLTIAMDEIVVSKAKASAFLKWLGNS